MSPHDANDRDAVSAFGIYDLPDDLLLNVINAVPVLDRGAVSGASKRLRTAAFAEGIGLYIPDCPLVAYKGQLSRLAALLVAGKSFKRFWLFLIIAHTTDCPVDLARRLRELIAILPDALPFVRELIVQPYERVNSHIIAALQSRPAPQLQSLVIGSQYDTMRDSIPQNLFSGAAPNLQSLKIDIAPTVVLTPVPAFFGVKDVTIIIHPQPGGANPDEQQPAPRACIDITTLFPAVRRLSVRAYGEQKNTSINLSGLQHLEYFVYDAFTEGCFSEGDLRAAAQFHRAPSLRKFRDDDYWVYRILGTRSLNRAAVGLGSQ